MDQAVRNNERFVVDRRSEPAVVILSVKDFLESVSAAPDWLRQAWTGAKQRGLDKLTSEEIDDEIRAHRRGKRLAPR